MPRLINFINDRIGWNHYLKPFMYKELPSGLNWSATLGTLCALLFVVEAVTGMFLAMYYNPAPDLAYESINFITNDVPLGNILRGIHHWGASALVILVFSHLMTSFFSGSFKAPRELTWVIGVFLFLITLGLGFTGYLLPWDKKAYWATVVSSNIPRDIPLIGDFITRIILGGDRVSGLTLTRFFSAHMLIFPSLMLFLLVLHIYFVRIHGMAEPPLSVTSGKKPAEQAEDKIYRFYPEHLFRCAIAFTVVFSIILLLTSFAQIPLDNKVGTVDEAYLPRPEWYFMWLFQLLTFFSGRLEVIGSLVIPLGGVIILLMLPWISKNDLRGLADRPLATAVGISCIVGIVYLTFMGFSGARSYGKIIPLPDRKLDLSEKAGLKVFVEQECAYCHNINGQGGKVQGPDLANMLAKDRTRDQLMKFIRDPQAVSRWSIMPKYDLDEKDLQAVTSFILALDFDTYSLKIIKREQALAYQEGKIE